MPQASRTVLVVDDSPEDRELYRRYLLRDPDYSYTIIEAELGQRGLELWQQHHPDVVLLDYRLPDLDGLEFLTQLTSATQPYFVPVIVVTGQGSEAIAVKAMKAGAQDYLVKGQITPESLQWSVNHTIEAIQLRIQVQQGVERERIVSQMTLKVHQTLNLEEILQTTVSEVRQYLKTDRVLILQVEADGRGTVITESVDGAWMSLLSNAYPDPCLVSGSLEPLRQGMITSKSNIHDGSVAPCHVKLLVTMQVQSHLVVPIRQYDQLWGMLIVHHCSAPRQWQATEIALLKDLTTQLGIALKQAELHQQTQTELAERKRVEAKLRESNERLQMALDGSGGGLWSWNIATNEWYTSPRWLEILGYKVGELSGHYTTWEQLMHPEEKAWVLKQLTAHLQDTSAPYQFEYRMLNSSGEWKWVANYGKVVRQDDQGNPLQMAGIQFDISEHKRAQEHLRASEERFRTSVENMLDCFAIYRAVRNDQGQIEDFQAEYINDAACISSEIAREAHLSRGLCDLLPAHRSSGLFDEYCQVVKTGKSLAKEDLIYEDQLGQRRLARAYDIRVAKYEDGFVATWRDITDRKWAEAEREQLLERERTARATAERANRIKDEFLAILSHELRSPLNPILGWARLLQTHSFDPTVTAKALATIERNAKLQTQLINDLLDVARILRGKLKLDTTLVDLGCVTEAAMETVRLAALAKQILIYPVLPNVGHVSGDATRLQQIVWNLLSNAIKFTPAHGRVDIRLEQVENHGRIIVSDTGKGIKPEFVPHLFESFRQEDASTTRSHGGLGLGLAIVRYLVEAHGGTVWAYSAGEGKGATFTVELPLVNADSEAVFPSDEITDTLDLTGLRVLTVDDDPDTCEFITALLTAYGAEALTLSSATEVLENIESFQPDVLISDIGMPEVDGYTLLQKIRAMTPDDSQPIPAIAVTAYAREEDRRNALAHGFQEHIAKPLDPSILAAAILELTSHPVHL